MKPVVVPTTDVNSETCTVVSWHVEDGGPVRRDDLIAEVETSKTVIEIFASEDGFLLHNRTLGEEMPMGENIAHIFENESAVAQFRAIQKAEEAAKKDDILHRTWRATKKAEELAAKNSIDLATIDKGSLITTKAVEAAIEKASPIDYGELPPVLETDEGIERVMIIGGGLGATQVLDIFDNDPGKAAVGMVDDGRENWGKDHRGVPIVGGTDRLEELFKEKKFDTAIVSISTSIPARTKFREACRRLGIPMANAIDSTCKIASDVTMGTGNVICAFCHFGAGAVVGDNNFVSAYNSFDHHCTLGNDISTGPGCMASGIVKLGDRVRLGTGIFFEPYIEIGDDVQVASGAVLMKSVPADHIVKVKTGHISIVPSRR